MGIDRDVAGFLLHAHSMNVSFDSTLMIGRQSLYESRSQLDRMLQAHSRPVSKAARDKFVESRSGFCEEIFACLGASKVDSMDASGFEGATVIQDLNKAIPESYDQKYDVVFDGGSLEHVFDVCMSFKNCMRMVKVGGHFLGVSPANSFVGHGFYQFSPELFFEVFCEQNGFRVKQLILVEYGKGRWYQVSAPRDVRSRVLLGRSGKIYAMVVAERINASEIFATSPQQSDYSAAWEGEGVPAPSKIARKTLDSGVYAMARHLLYYSFCKVSGRPHFEPSYFKRLK
ncbi:MAG TPA: hypothetical protein DDZ51_02910 [Planctomycetaceae bacterium]|nr:hypothetical protein [Planctomycetaceae bacterium]